MQPKFSHILDDLVNQLGIVINWDKSSSTSTLLRVSKISFGLNKADERVVVKEQQASVLNQTQNDFQFDEEKSLSKSTRRQGRTYHNFPLQTIQERDSTTMEAKNRPFQNKFNFIEQLRKNAREGPPQDQESIQKVSKLFQKQQVKLRPRRDSEQKKPLPVRVNYHLSKYIRAEEPEQLKIQMPLTQRQNHSHSNQSSQNSWLNKDYSQHSAPKRILLQPLKPLKPPRLQDYMPEMKQRAGVEESMRATVRWRKNMFIKQNDLSVQNL